MVGWLIVIYGITTVVGYLMINPVYTHTHTHIHTLNIYISWDQIETGNIVFKGSKTYLFAYN